MIRGVALLVNVDIAVVGGGVVGCAVARQLSLMGAKTVLLEKGPDILEGASKGNSAILHTGFDAPVGTLEQKCVARGYQEYLKIHKSFNLPLLKTGAIIAAWSEEEEEKFAAIMEKAWKNGVGDLRILTAKEVLALEPGLGREVRAGIHVPGEYVVDPWSTPLAYIRQAVANGCKAIFNAEVSQGEFDGRHWDLQLSQGMVRAKYVVNCAGLYGDRLDLDLLKRNSFTIKPRKGQFVIFDKAAGRLLKSVILPVPTARTKGIVLFPTIFGNVMVGPTAEEQEGRSDASVTKEILHSLKEQAIKKLPELAKIPVTTTFAGIRSATEEPQYRVFADRQQHWITLGGIRSTGLTSALGLAAHTQDLLVEMGAEFTALAEPVVPRLPNLAEHLPRDYQNPGYGEMVCHCELVTEREIKAALQGPLGAGNLGGLKRRTRATMGICQGFHCLARVAELTDDGFDQPIGIKSGNEDRMES